MQEQTDLNIERHKKRILKHLANAGGTLPHTVLLMRNNFALNAKSLRLVLRAMKLDGTVTETWTAKEHTYSLAQSK